MLLHNGCFEIMMHSHESLATDELRVGVMCLVLGKLSVDKALCDIIDNAILEGSVTL